MSVVADRLSNVTLGVPQAHLNLTLFPLLGDGPAEPDYLLLDEALKQGCARVTEVSKQGSVPELRFVNECDRRVLLLDGEALIGAKQNRILNLTVLAPAHKTVVIPVSCVEAGRWHAQSTEFSSTPRTHYSAGRARKAAQVSESLRSQGTRRSDQSQVWADIKAKSRRMGCFSPTAAAEALYQTNRMRLDEYLGAFSPVEGQVGALFAINGTVVGLDLFDSHPTLSELLHKLIESYALDAIDASETGPKEVVSEQARRLLHDVAKASVEQFVAVGEGEDLRLRGERLVGGALLADGQLVHLCAFRLDDEDGGHSRSHDDAMARASQRRRGRLDE